MNMSETNQENDTSNVISPEDPLGGKVKCGIIEEILGEMKSEFNKANLEKPTKLLTVQKDTVEVKNEASEVVDTKQGTMEDFPTKIEESCQSKSGEKYSSDAVETKAIKTCEIFEENEQTSNIPPTLNEKLSNASDVVTSEQASSQEEPVKVIKSDSLDDTNVTRSIKLDEQEVPAPSAKRSLRSQKVTTETAEPAGVKRSARRRSKDSPRESVLQSAIARKEKSFSNLNFSDEKPAYRNVKALAQRTRRHSTEDKSHLGKSVNKTGEKGKIIDLPKSPRLLSQFAIQCQGTPGKSDSIVLAKGRSSSEIKSALGVAEDMKQELETRGSGKSQVPPTAAAAYTKTGKRRYKPYKGLRYSFTSGPGRRSKLGKRQGRESSWSESSQSSIPQSRKIATRNSGTSLEDSVDPSNKVETKQCTSKRDIATVSPKISVGNVSSGRLRSESPVVADACQTAGHKRKIQPGMEELEDEASKRCRPSNVPSPSPAEDSQGPSKPESTAISSGAGTAALCCCQVKSPLFVTARTHGCGTGGELYCQAVDSLDSRMVGCSNSIGIMNVRMCRPSLKVPYMILCEVHVSRLLRHNCCPGCGIFCTQGRFVRCASFHVYHRECQLLVGDKAVCPHCGVDSPLTDSILQFGASKNPVFLPQQKTPKKYPSAKMSLGGSSTPNVVRNENGAISPIVESCTLTLTSGRVISAEGLPSPIDKEKLVRLFNIVSHPNDNSSVEGSSPNVARYTPKTLYHAAKSGNAEKLLSSLAAGMNPNHQYRDIGMGTALHAASAGNHLLAVHLLLQAGAQLDLMDREQHTPLMLAATAGHNAVVKFLIKAGACATLKGSDGMTALHLAAKAGNLEACHYLLSSPNIVKSFIDMVDDGGWTPLVWAAEHCHTPVASYLLGKRADPLIRDAEQNIALHWSAFSGSVDITEMLLNYGCEINSTNTHGDTPLHIGARQNMYGCVLLLLARGADINISNNSGDTPQNCCSSQSTDCFQMITMNMELLAITSKAKQRELRLLCNDISRGKEANPIQCVNCEDDEEEPHDYVYVSENCFTSNIIVNRTITSLQSCRCEDTCTTGNCLCGSISLRCWYDDDGRLVSDFNYADPPMLFECNQACACNSVTCNNRVVQNGLTARFQLFRTRGKGWGVRTLRPILKGTYVCEYIGEIISDCEADHREDDSYLFDLDNKDGETYCIDARRYGNVARFINHMCVPNLQPVRVFIDHQDLHFPRIAFFANRDIGAEEELGFDYGEKFWIIKCKSFTCTCGASTCRYSEYTIRQTLKNYKARLQEESNEH